MRVLRAEAEQQGCVASPQLPARVDQSVRFAGLIAAARSIPIAASELGQFISLEDEHGLVEARLSPDAYARLHPLVTTPGPFLVDARVEQRRGVLSLAILELLPFYQRAGAWRGA
jgi:DNA polymerase III alpha subunit